MSTQFNPQVLEARFCQLAVALRSGANPSGPATRAVVSQARRALRAVDGAMQPDGAARLGRGAARLARSLAASRSAAFVAVDLTGLAQTVVQLGIEMGRRLAPQDVAAIARNVFNGSAELSDFKIAIGGPIDALDALFTRIALVVAIAQYRVP